MQCLKIWAKSILTFKWSLGQMANQQTACNKLNVQQSLQVDVQR